MFSHSSPKQEDIELFNYSWKPYKRGLRKLVKTSLLEEDPSCLVSGRGEGGGGGVSKTPPVSHEHNQQKFIGFKI